MRPIDADELKARFDVSDRVELLTMVIMKAPSMELVPQILEMTIQIAEGIQEAVDDMPTLTVEEFVDFKN